MTRPLGRWRAGESGNPRGRPKGIRDKRLALRDRIEAHADELIALALTAARAGDITALSLLLARAVAPMRPASAVVSFDLPADATPAHAGRAVLAAVAAGRLSPDTGKQLIDGLAGLAKLVELDELDARLRALEERA